MGEILNIDDVTSVGRSAKQAGGSGDNTVSLARNHGTELESMRSGGLVGKAGNTFQQVGATNTAATGALAKQFADKALRMAGFGTHAMAGDDDAEQQQQPATAMGEATLQAISKPINV